ncbi:MAG TPA: hypothetical protein VKB80_13850 [Kofleriaceae bacterium]|nr:hypothetical protein [Kofleriaceae bacterium]
MGLAALFLALSCLGRDAGDLEDANGAGDPRQPGAIVLPDDYPDPPGAFTAVLVAPGAAHPPDPFAPPAPDGELEAAR